MKSLQYERHESLFLLVHATIAPLDEEWYPYAETLIKAAEAGESDRLLVLTDGAGPNAVQREVLQVANSQYRVAVVTGSRIGRGIATALRWFGTDIRAFPPSNVEGALSFLAVEPESRTPILRKLGRMRLELAGDSSADVAAMSQSELMRIASTPQATLTRRLG